MAQQSAVPTLVVRAPERLLRWANGEQELSVFVGVDFSTSSDAALAWAGQFRKFGACTLRMVHVRPTPVFTKLNSRGAQALGSGELSERRRLIRDLRKTACRILGAGELSAQVEIAPSSPDAVLVRAATEAQADLLVVGTHQRHGFGRLVRHSTSRGVLRNAPINVVCVPIPTAMEHGVGQNPEVRRVLVATDFSRVGDQAISWGHAFLRGGGTVRLVHILPPWEPVSPLVTRYEPRRQTRGEYRRAIEDAHKKLAALIPPAAAANGITTEVEVIAAKDPARAIQAAAVRFGADVLCVGSKGHGAFVNVVLGSVAQKLVAMSGQPVLLVRPSRR